MTTDTTQDSALELVSKFALENVQLRRLLACTYSGARLYMDDGELSDSSTLPFIDFKRDSATDIEHKMLQRLQAAFSKVENIQLDEEDAMLNRFMKVE